MVCVPEWNIKFIIMSAPSSPGTKRPSSDSGGKGKIGPDRHADQRSSSSKGGKGQAERRSSSDSGRKGEKGSSKDSEATRATRRSDDAGSRSTGGRGRSRSRSEERRRKAHTLAQQLKFLKDVCFVPHKVILDRGWATCRDRAGWTVLHWAAEHLNKRDCSPGWLDEIDIEGFITKFVERGGEVNAVIRGGSDEGQRLAGQAALHMVAHRRKERVEEHEHNICRFAKALIVQGRADADLAQRNDRGRVPLTLALNTGRIELAKTLVQQGANPMARDGQGQTTWEVCSQHRMICAQLREFIQNDMRSNMASPWHGSRRSRRGEAPVEEIIRRL